MKKILYLAIVSVSMALTTLFAETTAVDVSFADLLRNPAAYSHKRISTVAYYDIEHHGPYLCADSQTAKTGAAGQWRVDVEITGAKASQGALRKRGLVRITGRFRYREMVWHRDKDGNEYLRPGFGFMNMGDKQVSEITHFDHLRSK